MNRKTWTLIILLMLLAAQTIVASAYIDVVNYYADEAYPPYSYQTAVGMDGFDVELIQRIFQDPNYHLVIRGESWPKVLDYMTEGKADVISALAITEERKGTMLFTDPILQVSQGFFGTDRIKNFSMNRLQEYSIGIGEDYSDFLLLEELGILEYNSFSDLEEAMHALMAGRIDLVFAEEDAFAHVLIQNRLQGYITTYEGNLFPRTYHYAVNKEKPELVSFINGRLEELKETGVYEATHQKYLQKNSPHFYQEQRKRQISIMAIVGLLLIGLIVSTRYFAIKNQMSELQASYEEIRAMEEELSDQVDQLQHYISVIEHMAHHDELTGLPNMRSVHEYLEEKIEAAGKTEELIAFVLMDLDDFKSVNDIHGHAAGDQLLIELGNRLSAEKREDSMVARMGGDEFILCINKIKSQEALRGYLDHLLEAIHQPVQMEEVSLYPYFTAGVALYPTDATDASSLFACADAAMHQAKKEGSRRYQFFYQEIKESVQKRVELEADIYKAIEEKEFSLEYQPQFEAITGLIKGVEVLIRWNHPQKGVIPPSEFIPVAEDSGQIVEIGRWVMEEASKKMHEWKSKGREPLNLSVNVSIRQMQHPSFLNDFKSYYELGFADINHLKLEVTESISMMDSGEVLASLEELSQMGVRISLDDFGTGFSSMNHLKAMPVQEVKIDKSFVNNMENSASKQAIVRSMIKLAHALDKTVVAEGVETKKQAELLCTYQCDMLQGYYYAKPMTWEAFVKRFYSCS
ncbi:EAL domain-containing protein [Tindallia californiensis]|uniref:Diguanylate cyclase (GGDEF) domain-containing protein n=1 Tax=Tindallia californiensis TaxID=159292 RepID=A0A1H3Q9W3_9FIRM|nr:EAL domain-containing protein [Tindallia californiensis]SDZ09489.1 diguanylate cyclase (GGDEF) domain-containing protein [Tindallia californiensis]